MAAGLCHASREAIEPGDCLVIVLSTTPMEGRPGTGFTIGDGTLVVTPYHVAAEASQEGEHRMLGVIKVVSPYLGQCCYAEIVALSERRDLILLKVPWAGHPAFELATNQELLQATDLEVVGILPIISAIPPESTRPFPPSLIAERNVLEIDFVAVRQQIPRFVSLAGRGQMGPGWSGAPMIIPETLKAAGCFVRLNKSVRSGELTSQGPALAQAKRLAKEGHQSESLTASEPILPRAADGYAVTRLFLQANKLLVRDDYAEASAKAEELLTLRPESPVLRVLAAQLQEEQDNSERAEAHYQTALGFDPKAPMPRMMYGQFLLDRDPDKGLEILGGLWGNVRMRPWLILVMWNVLSERPLDENGLQRLQEALAVEPANAYLWFNLGGAQIQLGPEDEGFRSMIRAVELLPERGSLRGHLARLLEKNGRLDEAEEHFRSLLPIEPENPVVHFWLARFLLRHRPEARAEALRVAQRALALQPRGGLPRNEIERLIEEIRAMDSHDETSVNKNPLDR